MSIRHITPFFPLHKEQENNVRWYFPPYKFTVNLEIYYDKSNFISSEAPNKGRTIAHTSISIADKYSASSANLRLHSTINSMNIYLQFQQNILTGPINPRIILSRQQNNNFVLDKQFF